MQEPEPIPRPERPESASAWPGAGTGAARGGQGEDHPTVVTGPAGRKPRGGVPEGGVPLPVPGDRVDSFELEESIGVGGMGAVFRALDARLDRHVALKILPPEQAGDPEVVQRFYQEGRAAARLDNENIARVYTIGHDPRYHFIAFEYIEGTTIRQRVERHGPLPVSESINYTLQIAGALVHAAERGVVHRDIKPSNIIVTPQGRAKLVDMGLARRFERGGDDGLTQSGMTLGTFDYISPEQARDPRDVDVRSDLYSLGCTLFHMLTGRPPFPEGTVLQKLLQHQEDAPPDVRGLNPDVSPDLANILVKLMAKDRDRRYQTPEQLVRDLLTVAGALGLRSLSPEGLVWMSAAHPPGWERHLVWALPPLALAVVVAGLVWWGQDEGVPAVRNAAEAEPHLAADVGSRRAREAPPTAAPVAVAAPAEAVEPEPDEEPEPAPRERLVDSGEDLLGLAAAAPPRSVLILSDEGPYLLRGQSGDFSSSALSGRDLTIKADKGVRPELRLAREPDGSGGAPAALLDFVGGRVTLEGLTLVLDPGNRQDSLAAIRTRDTELTVRRCLFRRRGERATWGRLSALQVESSTSRERPVPVTVEACHFDGGQVGVLATGPADLVVSDCTMSDVEPVFWFENGKAAGAVPADLRLRHLSLMAPEGPVFRFEGTAPRVRIDDSVIAPARNDVDCTLVATDAPDQLDWRGRGNVYQRIAVFLQSTGTRSRRDPVRDWSAWEDSLPDIRETDSLSTRARIWDESDPAQSLARDGQNPSRSFRLHASRPGPAELGARQGPFGPVATGGKVAASTPETRLEPGSGLASATPSSNDPVEPPTPAPSEPAGPPEPAAAKVKIGSSGMPEMPVMPPMEPDPAPLRTATTPEPRPAEEASPSAPAVKPAPNAAEADPAVLRTADRFLTELNQAGAMGGTLRIAADADWELPTSTVRGNVRWVLRAEPGPTRPRIRFRPSPADPKTPTAWSFWMELRSGSLQLDGIDVVLAKSDAPRLGRWAAFGVWGGADLSLTNCTVTIEGDQVISAALSIPAGENEVEEGVVGPEPSAAVVRISDSLVRSGGDLVEVAAGHRLDLELDNVVVSTEGSLVHAHGQPRGRVSEPFRLSLNQVTARTAGGLVQLESAAGEPDLPVADVRVRDSILATTPQGAPLFRVDGQDALTALRDRIKWEGHGVAYHQINAYRRDQSAQVGSVPNIYDRPSWMVAVGTKEAGAVHGDVRFLQEWEPGRSAWTLRREDVQLAPDSPASRAGADLDSIPEVAAGGS